MTPRSRTALSQHRHRAPLPSQAPDTQGDVGITHVALSSQVTLKTLRSTPQLGEVAGQYSVSTPPASKATDRAAAKDDECSRDDKCSRKDKCARDDEFSRDDECSHKDESAHTKTRAHMRTSAHTEVGHTGMVSPRGRTHRDECVNEAE